MLGEACASKPRSDVWGNFRAGRRKRARSLGGRRDARGRWRTRGPAFQMGTGARLSAQREQDGAHRGSQSLACWCQEGGGRASASSTTGSRAYNVARAVAPDGMLGIFAAAGLDKPDASILSEEFLAEVRGMRERNLAVELLRKLLKGALVTQRRKNVVQARSFAEMLEQTIRRYQNRAVEAAQVIEELIGLAREMRTASAGGEAFGLSNDELAFYDALGVNDSAVQVLGDGTLRGIARELVETVRNNVTIDWTQRENVRAKLRVLVKRVLRKDGNPPDTQESATRTVL